MRHCFFWLVALLAWPAAGAERAFDFSDARPGQAPAGFRSLISGKGQPGDWKIILDDVATLMPSHTGLAPNTAKKAVLAQLAQDPTDDHYPLLVLDNEVFSDFTLTTRFKLAGGSVEQMAGIAFRIQDEKNYYYVRASGLGNTFCFFKFVNGELIGPYGPKVEIAKGVWHEMTIECRGSLVTCSLDGKVMIPGMRQDTFTRGKIGFWTKSDSVSYFSDTRIVYTPLEMPAQALVRKTLKKYSRLLGLKIYVAGEDRKTTRLVGSNDATEAGRAGEAADLDVIARGVKYYGKTKHAMTVTLPLRDRNGDPIAAVRVIMKTFPGQTQKNALERSAPILREMQQDVNSMDDLVIQ